MTLTGKLEELDIILTRQSSQYILPLGSFISLGRRYRRGRRHDF